MTEALYDKNRRAWDLEPWFGRHLSAMTGEDLHNKADIAQELAYRDQQIESLRQQLAKCEAEFEDYMKAKVTEMDEAIRKAKREALLEAAAECNRQVCLQVQTGAGEDVVNQARRCADAISRMADELEAK